VLIQAVLSEIRALHTERLETSTSPYSSGYRDAIRMCEEIIQDVMFEAGVDDLEEERDE